DRVIGIAWPPENPTRRGRRIGIRLQCSEVASIDDIRVFRRGPPLEVIDIRMDMTDQASIPRHRAYPCVSAV
ncbi:hypothetical protein, partial [Candidatus Paracaedibacter symbiosus]|uniref:hypothetical protein n=1 Tax=Candidatus Paracaedibacter symbiosus TaxID=244582 RepID=UPI0018DCCFC1